MPKINLSPLFIGGVPWLVDQCSFYFFLDQFQYYSAELKAFYLQAQAQPANGLVEPASIHLGCIQCSMA